LLATTPKRGTCNGYSSVIATKKNRAARHARVQARRIEECARLAEVKNPRQAVAIALHEAGASKYESPKKNAANLRHTKAKERRGETYQDEAEGRRATQKTYRRADAKSTGGRSKANGKTRAQLYAEARRRNIPNRSKMNKAALERALHHP